EVPPAVPRRETPRLHPTGARLAGPTAAVDEWDGALPDDGVLHRVERRLAGAEARLDADERAAVALHARRLDLAQRLRRPAGERRVRPGAAGQAEHRQLVRLELDVGEGVLALVDAVAHLVVPHAADVLGDERDAELAQLVLVPLEHPVEGL